MESTLTLERGGVSPVRALVLKALMIGGALASLLYVAADVTASLNYPGYSYAHQAFSELLAIGSPVRSMMLTPTLAYNLLVIGFGAAVVAAAGEKRSLRWTGIFLLVYGMTSLAGPYVPMHARGAAFTLTDALHIADTVGMIVSMLLYIAIGAFTLGRAFRLYSFATVLAIFAGAGGAFTMANRIAAGLPTPWVGLVERVNIYAMLLWVAVFAIALLRDRKYEPAAEAV